MIEVDVTTRIARPIEDVYAFVVDPANRPKWDTSVLSEQQTSEGPLGEGSTLHTRMRVMGQESQFDWRVEEYTPPQVLAVTSTSGPLATSMRMSLVAVGAGTELTAALTAEPTGMMRLVEPIIEQSIRRDLTAAFDRLRQLLEA